MTNFSNKEIYDLINDTRREIKEDIGKLDERVGRLEVAQGITKTKLWMVVSIISILASAVMSSIVTTVVEAMKR